MNDTTARRPTRWARLRTWRVAQPRPTGLLWALSFMVPSTLVYVVTSWHMVDVVAGPMADAAKLTDLGQEWVRAGLRQQYLLAMFALIGATVCVAMGWRFSRRLWLVALTLFALAAALQVIHCFLVTMTQSGTDDWLGPNCGALRPLGASALGLLVATVLLFIPSVNRWRAALRRMASPPVSSTP